MNAGIGVYLFRVMCVRYEELWDYVRRLHHLDSRLDPIYIIQSHATQATAFVVFTTFVPSP